MIILLVIYLWLGVKSITFFRTKVFNLDYVYLGTFSDFIFKKVFWALVLGWITIPLWLLFSIFGTRKNE